jgi:hypothetical protein
MNFTFHLSAQSKLLIVLNIIYGPILAISRVIFAKTKSHRMTLLMRLLTILLTALFATTAQATIISATNTTQIAPPVSVQKN